MEMPACFEVHLKERKYPSTVPKFHFVFDFRRPEQVWSSGSLGGFFWRAIHVIASAVVLRAIPTALVNQLSSPFTRH